jgi:hypothetical protein
MNVVRICFHVVFITTHLSIFIANYVDLLHFPGFLLHEYVWMLQWRQMICDEVPGGGGWWIRWRQIL